MKMVKLFLMLAAISVAFAIPQQITYQGKATDLSGVALDGTYNITFRIFDAATGGTELWSEAHPSVLITKGLFDVILGSSNPITMDFSNQYFLQVEIGGEVLTPRIPLTAVGYAFRSANADTAEFVLWSNIDGIPAGFADGTDDVDDADNVVGNEVVTGLSFDTGTGVLSLTQSAGTSPITQDLDGRYLTSEVDGATNNELITAASYETAGEDILRITEAGTNWDITIDNEADDVTLADVQNACSNDFHNIGGTDAVNDADSDPNNELQTINANAGLTGGGSGLSVGLAVGDGAGISVAADAVDVNVDGSTIQINGSDQLYVANLPAGDGNYIQNQSASNQTADFRINGDGYWYGVTNPTRYLRIYSEAAQFITGSNDLYVRPGGALQVEPGLGNEYIYLCNNTGTKVLTVDGANQRVGIGTTSPAYKLDVQGNGRFTSNLTIGAYTLPSVDGSSGQVLSTNGSGTVSWQTVAGGGAPTNAQYVTMALDATLTNERVLAAGSGISITDGGAGGNVTISHTDASSQSTVNNSGGTVIQDVSLDWTGHTTGLVSIDLDTRYSTGSGTANYITKWTGVRSLGSSQIYDNGTNVGIGTTSPSYKLHVSGGSGTAICASSTGDDAIMANTTSSGHAAVYAYTYTSGAYGVYGISSSDNGYGVYGYSGSSTGTQRGVYGEAVSTTTGTSYGVYGYAYGNSGYSNAAYGVYGSASGTDYTYGVYGTASGGATNWAGYFDGNGYFSGNVGIGTTSPSYKLHINGGDVKIGNSAGDNRKLYFGDGTYVWVGEQSDDHLRLHSTSLSIEIGGDLGASGEVLKSNGSTVYWGTDATGGGGLWQDDGSYIRPTEYDGFRIYDNESGWIGLWFTPSSPSGGWGTSCVGNIYHTSNEHAYIAYGGVCGLQGDSDTENGVQGITSTSAGGYAGVYGENTYSGWNIYGIYGLSAGYAGVFGAGPHYGLWANSDNSYGTGDWYGAWLYGENAGIMCSGDLKFFASTNAIDIGGDYGTAGEVLTSNGSSGIYWGSGGGGGGEWTDNGTYLSPSDGGSFRVYEDDSYITYWSGSSTNLNRHYTYNSVSSDGSSYSSQRSCYYGYNYYGNLYSAAVYGKSFLDYDRSSGVFGSNSGASVWGALGYQVVGGTEYGGYFTTYTSGSGLLRSAGESEIIGPQINVGIGAWGDLFAADFHGKVYGTYSEGTRYASFDHGHRFTDALDIHLQNIGEENKAVLFTNTSTDVSVYASGYGKMKSGTCKIKFDENFSSVVSDQIPVVVTVTPLGPSEGIYIAEVNENGFTVVEDNNGTSDVKFSWIAVGRRKGYENPQLPQEVIASDYTEKISRGLHNDADTETDCEGLYFQNGELFVGRHPSTIPGEELIALKNEFAENPSAHTYQEWINLFASVGSEFGISQQEFENMIAQDTQPEPMFDVYGNQIPIEWIDTLRKAGYPMFTYEQVMQRRLEGYLSDAQQIRYQKENTQPKRYEREIIRNGLMKYTDLQTGKVFYKNSKGEAVTADGEVIRGDGKPTKAKIYQRHPEADPANYENNNVNSQE